MLELHAAGASARQIAEDVGLSDRAVRNWLADKGLEANGRGGKPRVKPKPRPEPETLEAAQQAAAALIEPTPVGSDRQSALQLVTARLSFVRSLIDRLAPAVQLDEYPASAWGQLVRLEGELATRVAELAPAEAPDPESDPANVDAAAMVRAKLARIVAAQEQDARCVHCGRAPFAAQAGAA